MSRRSNPFEELERVFDRMSRQFDASNRFPTENPMGRWAEEFESMAVDLVEQDDAYVVTADLPGFERDDVDVQLTDSTLRIEAEREEATEEEEDRYIRQERRQQSAQRSVRLPGEVDRQGVNARMQNGVLTVTLPKRESGDVRDIEIE